MLILAVALMSGTRKQERTAMRLALGDDSTQVLAMMGPPGMRCATGPLAHLTAQLPVGTPRPTAEAELARLRDETVSRWVYPPADEAPRCVPQAGSTEIGWGPNGRILWMVPLVGRHPVVYTPEPVT